MKHYVKLYEEFIESINEGFTRVEFYSHKNHNPYCDILEGYLDKDSFITYGIYIKDNGNIKKGDEFIEYYAGSNYVVNSTKRSTSRMWKLYDGVEIPSKYQKQWNELKDLYNKEYKNK